MERIGSPSSEVLLDASDILVVVASRLNAKEFARKSATFRSLNAMNYHGISLLPCYSNQASLSVIYNMAIDRILPRHKYIVFAHDDLHFLDFYWPERLRLGLSTFDIVGVAGNRRCTPGQPAWPFLDLTGTPDSSENFSGQVAHGAEFPPKSVNYFGPSRVEVELLDGLFIACRIDSLLKSGIRFDERFDFHFYDLDFTRTARKSGLTCGTWDISLMHESEGGYGSPSWVENYYRYISKWES